MYWKADQKISFSLDCCYGNRNRFFVFYSVADISAGGQAIALIFWQYVLLKQRYILCSEHNLLRLIDFL